MLPLTAFALVALLLLCLHETGCRVQALLPDRRPPAAAESVALGMAAWIAIGGQSFMQALVLMVAPAGFALLFDTLFCLLLAGLLLDTLGRRLGCAAPFRCVTQLLLVTLDAQPINLSAVYSGAALVLALLLLALRVVAGGSEGGWRAASGTGMSAGLLAGALCALKMPDAMFAALLLGGLWALLVLQGRRDHGIMAGAALATGALVLVPWLLVFWRTQGQSVLAWLGGHGAPSIAGAGLMALTAPALHLDFARNPVFTLHGTALGAPWTP